jgi:formate hydrogenlyase subunit 3/multisubunit Na+/H+ antiporter MnhD subunit
MFLLLVAAGILVAGGVLALFASQIARLSNLLGAAAAVAGSTLGLIPVVRALAGGPADSLHVDWNIPGGSFFVELDALSAWFLLPILGLTGLAAIYGSEYLRAAATRKWLGPPWFFYNLLTASMVLVVIARNGMLFLIAWEVMALASYFLVTFDDQDERVQAAGWTYLVATHLGTAFLLALFALLGGSGTMDFDHFADNAAAGPASTGLLFVLAVVGFGTKAGFMPLHVWLPEAHPVAPSHVSAVLSGVMIKTGIYGLLRILGFLGTPALWWGWLLIVVGAVSGLLGIVLAQAQHDLKRVLAYSSVENIGIITLGLGAGVLGLATPDPLLAVLGFSAALLHVLNHALFKGLLFLGAGAVLHGAGTVQLDRLGGLIRRMPRLAAAFLIGAVAICGIPPLNGFTGEFLLYLGAFKHELTHGIVSTSAAIPPLLIIAVLALIGGLAVACFTRAFGIVFLGEPRTEQAAHAHAPRPLMSLPIAVLAAGCVVVGIVAPQIVSGLTPVLEPIVREDEFFMSDPLFQASDTLGFVVVVSGLLLALVAALTLVRWLLLRHREVTESGTWGCGYTSPTPRMQYTASSFAEPIVAPFRTLLRRRKTEPTLTAYFPAESSVTTETPDVVRETLGEPAFRGAARGFSLLRWLQQGRVHLYVLYVALTILALLVWYLGVRR